MSTPGPCLTCKSAPPPGALTTRAPAGGTQHALVQKLACAYWCFHYAKRIVETFTVHK